MWGGSRSAQLGRSAAPLEHAGMPPRLVNAQDAPLRTA